MHPGIDYGRGVVNVDRDTGIRYGVISAHDLAHWFWDEVECHYDAHCPKCGNDAVPIDQIDEDADSWEDAKYDCIDFGCPDCEYLFGESAYGDEPSAQTINGDDLSAHVDSDGDVWVTSSEYYTRAQFCSPCAPGAGHLGCPYTVDDENERLLRKGTLKADYNGCADEAGFLKVYCLDHEWFEGGCAPYPVFRVSDDSRVLPVGDDPFPYLGA